MSCTPRLFFLLFILISQLFSFNEGIGITGGNYQTLKETLDLSNSNPTQVRQESYSIDFYGSLSLSNTETDIRRLINDALDTFSYRFSYEYSNYYLDNTDYSPTYISPTYKEESLSLTLMYNLYDLNNGMFLDVGMGYRAFLGEPDTYEVDANTLKVRPSNYIFYEVGLGQSFKYWAYRFYYQTGTAEHLIDYHAAGTLVVTTTSEVYTLSRPMNVSLIFWW